MDTRILALPELDALRELRRALARGGLPSRGRRSAADEARLVAFRAVDELVCFLDAYERRVALGEPCRLIEREHAREPGRLTLEIEIEP